MTFITDAKKLLDQCQGTEDSLYDLISIHIGYAEIMSFQYNITRALVLQKECRQMAGTFDGAAPLTTKSKLRNQLLRMALRLEAAVMFIKNYLKLHKQIDI
jgi:hypothetical protein